MIDFCIPYIPAGLMCLEHLIDNLLSTAKSPEKIRILVSYHTEEALNILQSSSCYSKIFKTVFSPSYPENLLFHPSANHSAAINCLTKETSSETIILSDYDMAFLYRGWDEYICEQLENGKASVAGVCYAPLYLNLNMGALNEHMPWLPNTPLVKYQDLPNLSFFCIKKEALTNVFNDKLTEFDAFLSSGGIPFRLINTLELAVTNNLPLGSMQWLDTGHEIPGEIFSKGLKYQTFAPQPYHDQCILSYIKNPKQVPTILLPEIFYLMPSKTPFICHFKKGSAKMSGGNGEDEFIKFTNDVRTFLEKN